MTNLIKCTLPLLITLFACNSSFHVVENNNSTFHPKYLRNGGTKRETIFNKTKVDNEELKILLIKSIASQSIVEPNPTNENSKIDRIKNKASEDFNRKLTEIQHEIETLDINDKNFRKKLLELDLRKNNLLCQEREGISQLDDKIEVLSGDLTFNTGSSIITKRGKQYLDEICASIHSDAERWKKYVNRCNQRIFENEIIVVVIDISGYADRRGDETSNLVLSQERSNEVEKAIRIKLESLTTASNIKFDLTEIFSTGYGEKLPPGYADGPADDPSRRICLINYMVGPKRFLSSTD